MLGYTLNLTNIFLWGKSKYVNRDINFCMNSEYKIIFTMNYEFLRTSFEGFLIPMYLCTYHQFQLILFYIYMLAYIPHLIIARIKQ